MKPSSIFIAGCTKCWWTNQVDSPRSANHIQEQKAANGNDRFAAIYLR
jgi:hypothetical protein